MWGPGSSPRGNCIVRFARQAAASTDQHLCVKELCSTPPTDLEYSAVAKEDIVVR